MLNHSQPASAVAWTPRWRVEFSGRRGRRFTPASAMIATPKGTCWRFVRVRRNSASYGRYRYSSAAGFGGGGTWRPSRSSRWGGHHRRRRRSLNARPEPFSCCSRATGYDDRRRSSLPRRASRTVWIAQPGRRRHLDGPWIWQTKRRTGQVRHRPGQWNSVAQRPPDSVDHASATKARHSHIIYGDDRGELEDQRRGREDE